MRVLFINLDRATDRRAMIEEQGARLALDLERVRAVEATEVGEETLRTLGRSWERPLSAPELACFLSHRAVWMRVAAGTEPALILEDDAVLSPRVPAVLAAAQDITDVDLLNLEDFSKRRFVERGGEKPLVDGVRRARLVREKAGAAAYVLWPSGARKLLRIAERRAGPADAFLYGARLRSWIVEPALAAQVQTLAARGLRDALDSSVQAPRRKLPLTTANSRFFLRRLRAQLALLPHHVLRLRNVRYRRVSIDPADFSAEPKDLRKPS